MLYHGMHAGREMARLCTWKPKKSSCCQLHSVLRVSLRPEVESSCVFIPFFTGPVTSVPVVPLPVMEKWQS